MADDRDNPGFLRKVAKFVANPTTDWSDLTRPPEALESELDKAEIKAMIERKRRNDFVRKREFDMLRKIRREGLASASEGAVGGSNLDSEPRASDIARPDVEVKAKIDAIEQQMVGESLRRHAAAQQEYNSSFYNAATQPAALSRPGAFDADTVPSQVVEAARSAAMPAQQAVTVGTSLPGSGTGHIAIVGGPTDAAALDVSEVIHDPELDEAVIAFANADFDQCERSLTGLIGPSGSRSAHSETWLVLFDLYRATDQHQKFEVLAVDYAQRFGLSAPQWFSLPQQVAAAAAEQAKREAEQRAQIEAQSRREARAAAAAAAPEPQPAIDDGGLSVVVTETEAVGWAASPLLDTEAVASLRSQLLQLPYPWVLDFSALTTLEPQACGELAQMLRAWSRDKHQFKWLGAAHLVSVLQDATPTGDRDVDPALWNLRMEVMRMLNRSDQFDEVAIDYCVTYEVSPPSWEPAACEVELSEEGGQTVVPSMSRVSDVSTSFVESRLDDEPSMLQVASLELSGQMVGDISPVLQSLEESLGASVMVNIACTRLIRVDFIAAGDLLNWVLARRSENRAINFEEANRLVALFFGAMGITEHARVRIRQV